MRYGTFVLSPDRGWFHPMEVAMRHHGVRMVGINNITLLSDGTAVLLYELDGQREDVVTAVEFADEDVIDYQITADGDATLLRCHYHPTDLVDSLLGMLDEHAVMLEFPLTYVDPSRSALELTLIAAESELRDVVAAAPATVSVEVRRLGTYEQDEERLFTSLTDRKQEVARTAVERGYYEIPRQATCEDIAAEMGCSPATVAEHLRLIEQHLVTGIVPASFEERESRDAPRPVSQS
jgi:predicted DNA binding protein